MSRITYFSEAEGRAVTKKLRDNKIPCDVIHFDTGWFETDWRCDYQFSKSRFDNAAKMMADFKKMGIQTCLWQLPYFVRRTRCSLKSCKESLCKRPQRQSALRRCCSRFIESGDG
jgi:alpha-D-xyloside xylohydrolase